MILTINAGSTSLKYALFDKSLTEITRGDFQGKRVDTVLFEQMLKKFDGDQPIMTIVHRVVHGGPQYKDPLKITASLLNNLKKYTHLAPLHNPYNIQGIEIAQQFFPKAVHYAVFDTGFYRNLPEKTRIYPLPYEYYTQYGIQRYGFHGISHQYALVHATKKLNHQHPNLITLHLGGGCSMTAIKQGKPIDTSMGFTPLEGLMMWSRAGDIDAGILINSNLKLKTKNWVHILNHESGLKGIFNCQDYLDLLKKRRNGNHRARLAFDMFVYRIQKYIGAYYAALQGNVDALVFTGKIGAGDAITRRAVVAGLPFLRSVKKLVVQPNEEWMMAKLIQKLV